MILKILVKILSILYSKFGPKIGKFRMSRNFEFHEENNFSEISLLHLYTALVAWS